MNEEFKKINIEEKTEEKLEETFQQVPDSVESISNNKKIEEIEIEISLWKDKFLRKAAEFENYKKRVDNDQLALVNYAAESFIKKILPVVDDFERSLNHLNDAQDLSTIKTGIKLIYSKLMKILEEQGVSKIESLGKQFDVHFHEAIMQRIDDNVPPHTVLDEVESGYIFKDKVIRFAKVIVSSET
jgi:molecular chaperone GrpE